MSTTSRFVIAAFGLLIGATAGTLVSVRAEGRSTQPAHLHEPPLRGGEVAWWEAAREVESDKLRTIRVPADVLFPVGSARIDAAGQDLLRRLAPRLRDAIRVEVAGATDSTGSRERNIELSRLRAENAAEVLVAAGVPADRLVTLAWADDHPVADEGGPDREEARARNRRIEIRATLRE